MTRSNRPPSGGILLRATAVPFTPPRPVPFERYPQVVVFVLFKCVLFGKPDPNWRPDPVSSGNDADVASAFFLGMVGGAMLDRTFRKDRKSLYDDARDSFLWQEKIRRDNNIHDYYGEDF